MSRHAETQVSPALGGRDRDARYTVGHLVVDLARQHVVWRDKLVDLSVAQIRIVHALAQRPGVVKTYGNLMDAIEAEWAGIRSHMKRIRRAFERVDASFDMIEAIYKLGYRWRERCVDYTSTGRRSGIRLRSPVLTGGVDDSARIERRDAILAVVNGKRPGESLREASVRIVGHDLWASVIDRLPPRREVACDTPRGGLTDVARQRKLARRRARAAAIRNGTYVRTKMGSPEYSERLREAHRARTMLAPGHPSSASASVPE